MRAIEFVKKFGLGKAIDIVNDLTKFKDYRKPTHWDSDLNIYHDFKVLDESDVPTADLKQIVDAFELVERFGDLRQAKLNLEHMISHNQFEFCATNIDELQKAINLVERCQK